MIEWLLGLVCFILLFGVWIGGEMLGFYLFPNSEYSEPIGAALGLVTAFVAIGVFAWIVGFFQRNLN